MKLAEALQERADLNKRIDVLERRLQNNVVMQEGVPPVEQPEQLLTELNAALDRLELLVTAINTTNMSTMVEDQPLTALLARRDVLQKKLSILRNTIHAASNLSQRSRGAEIRQLAVLDVPAMQKQVDRMSHDFRLLDNSIQAANWTTDLIGL